MRWTRCLLVSFALLMTVQSARAQTYYVAPGGSDANPGSSAAPWATIQAFGNVGKAGDTLIVRAGTYGGAIFGWDGPNQGPYSQITGTAAQPIVIEADPSAAPGSVIINSRNTKNAVGFDLEPGCDYVNITGFTITNPGGTITKAGLEVAGSTGNQVLNNTIDGVGGVGGILIDTSVNVLVQGNTCIHVKGTGTTGHGMYLSGSSVNVTIRGNFLHDNDYVGLHINGDLSEGAPGVVTGAVIESNYIYNNGQNAINADGLQSSTIRNNLIYNYARSGIVLYQIDASGPGKNNKIYNNTIASPQSGAQAAIRIVDGGTGNAIFNNVLLGTGNIFLAISSDSLPGLISDYNAMSGIEQNDDTSATQTLAQWQAAGHDTHSFTSTATNLFVNTSTADYHLKSGSPAIDTGTSSLSSTNAPATDLDGNPRPSGATFDIGCYEVQATSGTPAITTTSPLPAGTVGAAYSKTFAASGGSGPYTYTISLGTAPAGLTLSSSGTLSGTPTTAGTATFTVQVKDSSNATSTKQFQLTINAALSITTSSLVQGMVNAAYSQTLALSGGTSPFTWSIMSGTLPAGLTLNAGTGAITGTPTAASSASITFKVTDTAGAVASKALTLTINTASVVSITTASPLPAGTVGAAYSQTFAGSGGTLPYAWSLSAGTLPAGLTLSGVGVLSGTPITSGTANFTVKATDKNNATATKTSALTVNPKLVLTSISVAPGGATVKKGNTQQFTATGLDQFGKALSPQPAFMWSVNGGGTISATGLFTASSGGTFTVTATSGLVVGSATVRVKAAPQLTSAASTSNPTVVVNTSATFTAGAIDPSGGAVTYAWDFGDGMTGNGDTIPHAYSALGNYTVTVTIADDAGDVTVSTLAITVIAGAQPPPLPMIVSKLAGRANFKSAGHDSFSISGTLPNLPASLVPAGQTLTLNVSGASATFTLDKNGHAKTAQGTFALKLKGKRDLKTHTLAFAGGDGTFTATLHNGTWAAGWGMDPATSATKAPMTLQATLQFLDNVYAQTVNATYTAKAGVGGKFKK